MQRKQKNVEKALKSKGFVQIDDHHRYFVYHLLNGKKTKIYTYTSHGNKEIDDFLIRQMANQCMLSKNDFLKFIDCSLKQNEYERLLISKNEL